MPHVSCFRFENSIDAAPINSTLGIKMALDDEKLITNNVTSTSPIATNPGFQTKGTDGVPEFVMQAMIKQSIDQKNIPGWNGNVDEFWSFYNPRPFYLLNFIFVGNFSWFEYWSTNYPYFVIILSKLSCNFLIGVP